MFFRSQAGDLLTAKGRTGIAPADPAHADRTIESLKEEAGRLGGREGRALAALLEEAKAVALLRAAAGNAPYLARLMQREAAWLPAAFDTAPSETRDDILETCAREIGAAEDLPTVMEAARLAKRRIALLTALADISEAWPLEEVTGTLSSLADTVLQAGSGWLLARAARKGEITLADPSDPTKGSGLVILAMGKYGARELNYSSDIDIIVFFEPERLSFGKDEEPSNFFVHLTRDLVKIMQEQTGGGYVFRTDLRLRPDAGATNVAMSVDAAEVYYESMGQNWERAAMIKARPCAGDPEAGERFRKMITPFVWRRYLDFAAIEDIHSLKRQIHAHRGHAVIAVEGHDIKLGRGGIREIEFFVQIQQLIGGGKEPNLRGRETLVMLEALRKEGWIDGKAANKLAEAYRFLRTLEHRIQMVNDEQTHRLPKSADGVAKIATFMGFKDADAFRKTLTGYLTDVQGLYAQLFEKEPSLSDDTGSLVFTGTDDDPDTVETLAGMGFEKPSAVIETVRKWHFGRIQATRAARSRGLLTKLTPAILRALGDTDKPDEALSRFDAFLSGQPAGVQFFSLLYQNPALLSLLAEIMGSAPMLARYLTRNPAVLEAVIAPDFYGPLPDSETREAEFAEVVERAGGFEQVLDLSRIYAREQMFQIGVQVLTGTAPAREAGPAYADLATAIVDGMVPVVQGEMMRDHGDVTGGAFAVIAMGKLGGREMAATSDLDLIAMYEFEGETAESDGPKPIEAVKYYTRMCQRLISALTAPTAEGPLYEVDMRLRPSGRAGPLATRLRSFTRYHHESAWTWEKMALTRARVISGTPVMRAMVHEAIQDVLCEKRDAKSVAKDVADMRERVFKELGSDALWDIKHGRGGLVDLEFIAQALQLIHAYRKPKLLDPNTHNVFEKLGDAGVITRETARQLVGASDLYHNLTQILRIAVDGPFKPENASEALRNRLCRAVDLASFSVVERELAATMREVDEAFGKLVERQAG